MKPHLIFGCLVLLIASGFSQTTGSVSEGDRAKFDNILDDVTGRVRGGDYKALNETAAMPASIAVPYLQFWTAPRNGPALSNAAGAALSNVQGYAEYFRQDMARIVAQGSIPGDDFIALGCIGTQEAAEVVAPYLFDTTLITLNPGEPPDTLAGWAETILEQMKLSDAPKLGVPTPSAVALVAWQKWAISKGFVPKDWTSRVGAPDWMRRMDAWKPPQTPPAAVAPQATHEPQHASAFATPGSSKEPGQVKTASPFAKDKERGIVWPLAILVVVLVNRRNAGSFFSCNPPTRQQRPANMKTEILSGVSVTRSANGHKGISVIAYEV
jgi:hypothetical protein